MATPWGMVLGCSVLTVNNCFLSTYCVLGRGHPPPRRRWGSPPSGDSHPENNLTLPCGVPCERTGVCRELTEGVSPGWSGKDPLKR